MDISFQASVKLGASILLLTGTILVFADTRMQGQAVIQLWGLNQLYFFQFKDKLKARAVPAIDKRFTFSTRESFLPAPMANHPSGFYDHPINIVLSNKDHMGSIYYTLDGSIPTTRSHYYEQPIQIDATTVLRFRSMESGQLPSETVNRTFFIREQTHMPVLSLIADPVTLWNNYSGIYHHPMKRGRRWERSAYVEYFTDSSASPIRFPVGLRIHGGFSRTNAKKSFRLTYRLNGAESTQAIPIGQPMNARSRRTVVLRQGGDGSTTRLRDELFQTLYAELGGFTSSFVPAVIFLNGKIWGIYNIREFIDEEYLHSMVGPGNYDLIREDRKAISGEEDHWNRTGDFFRTRDFSNDDEFLRASKFVDIDNLTDYWLMNIYVGNTDWPGWNTFSFRKRDGEDQRWRWISWDADQAFDFMGQGLMHNTLAWAIRDRTRDDLVFNAHKGEKDSEKDVEGTLIVRNLLKNDHYRKKFIRRFGDLVNHVLAPEEVEAMLDKIISMSKPDLPLDWERWSISESDYWREVEQIRHFARKRPEIIREYFRKEFGLGPTFTIRLFSEPAVGGKVSINTMEPAKSPWIGKYFQNEKISLQAKPSPGFRFIGWSTPHLGESRRLR